MLLFIISTQAIQVLLKVSLDYYSEYLKVQFTHKRKPKTFSQLPLWFYLSRFWEICLREQWRSTALKKLLLKNPSAACFFHKQHLGYSDNLQTVLITATSILEIWATIQLSYVIFLNALRSTNEIPFTFSVLKWQQKFQKQIYQKMSIYNWNYQHGLYILGELTI